MDSTPTTAEATATERALETVELLENILLHLPVKDLLVYAPRVCKQWQDVGRTSISIRRALFLEPLIATSTPVRANPFIYAITTSRYPSHTNAVPDAMLLTQPPNGILSFAQEELLFWSGPGEENNELNDKYGVLKGATTMKALREKAPFIVDELSALPLDKDEEGAVEGDALVPKYIRAGFEIEVYECDATGWEILLGAPGVDILNEISGLVDFADFD